MHRSHRSGPVAVLAAAAAFVCLLGPDAAPAAPRAVLGPEAGVEQAVAPIAQLRRPDEQSILGGRVRRFRQSLAGLPVLGAEAVLTDVRGMAGDLLIDSTVAMGAAPPPAALTKPEAVARAREAQARGAPATRPRASLAILPRRSGAVTVWRVLLRPAGPPARLEVLVDARRGAVLRVRDLLRRATGAGSVFDTNPVVAQGSRGSLSDGSPDSAFAGLYDIVALPRLNDADSCLAGRWARARLAGGEVCAVGRDFSSLQRSDAAFEAAMAYFHVDRTQDYVGGTLGIAGANDRQTIVNANGISDDNSFYDTQTKQITLGTGGADDGEDGEVIVHEYGHAMQDAQVPGFGASPEGGAMGEGFGDYLAAGQGERFASPRFPALDTCFAEWDSLGAGAPGDPPCLRRLDRDLTAAQVGPGTPCAGEIHCAGEAWSAALWDIRAQIGAVVADRLVIQSHFSLTANSGFQEGSMALLAADQALYGGTHDAFLRELLSSRGLLDLERLDDTPGAATLLPPPPTTVSGFLAAGRDAHDVYALDLARDTSIVLRLRGTAGELNLRLFRPGSTSVSDTSGVVAASETTGAREDLVHRAAQSGRHFVDVTATAGGGLYELTVLPDSDGDALPDGEDNCPATANAAQADRDRDSLGDACDRFPADPQNDRDGDGLGADSDNCPRVANRDQSDWDRDRRGDRCDRSARVTLKVARIRGSRVTVRATLRPSLLGPRAITVALQRRACASCAFRRVARVRGGRSRGKGRVDVTLTLRRGGSHRLGAVVRDRRYQVARARLLLAVR